MTRPFVESSSTNCWGADSSTLPLTKQCLQAANTPTAFSICQAEVLHRNHESDSKNQETGLKKIMRFNYGNWSALTWRMNLAKQELSVRDNHTAKKQVISIFSKKWSQACPKIYDLIDHIKDRTIENGSKLKEWKFRLDVRKNVYFNE